MKIEAPLNGESIMVKTYDGTALSVQEDGGCGGAWFEVFVLSIRIYGGGGSDLRSAAG